MKYSGLILLLIIGFCSVTAQTKWKLLKDKDGIRVYTGNTDNSKYKSIRVTCEFPGTIDKLQAVLRDVNHHSDWVYKAKNVSVIKRQSPDDIIYYLETEIPWPVTNRDGVYHLTMQADNMHHSFSALTVSLPGYVPDKNGCIRIVSSKATWQVTEATGKIKIDYKLEVDPRGGLPAWTVNLFSDKGPYETFKSLAGLLKK